MASLEEILKKLNKGKEENDKIKIASELETLTMEFGSTGSKYLDYYMGDKAIPYGAMTLLTGWESSGKTSISLVIAQRAQEKTGKNVVILDGEQTVTDSHIDRFGLDRSKLILYKDSALENMLDIAESFSTSEEVCTIIIDSVKAFFSIAVESKSAEDFTIGIEAKKLGTRLPIIHANCARRGIQLIILNQWRENPGAIAGDPRVLPGGNWNKYMPFVHLDFTKKDFIKDNNGSIIGHKLDVRIRKSKSGAYDKKESLQLDFYYDGGFKEVNEYARILIEEGVVKMGGAGWLTFPNEDGEEVKQQGLDKFVEYLVVNEDTYKYLKSLINV